MLVELRVRNLGVIADLTIDLGPGMTALTGETGAGKTLIVEALELLMGGRADAAIVRAESDEALVEGRFVTDNGADERVLARAVPANGRSRAWLDGRMTPVAGLAEAGGELIDLHGQHAHQSLLRGEAQRSALDAFGHVDLAEVRRLEGELHKLRDEVEAIGGNARARAREVDLLEYQLREIEGASIRSAEELNELVAEEDVLAAATDLAEAATAARDLVGGPAVEATTGAAAALGRHDALAEPAERLRGLAAELDDIATDLRLRAERFEEDPRRLAQVQERRRALGDLQRKYGDTLADVLAFATDAKSRLAALAASEHRRAELEATSKDLLDQLDQAEQEVRKAREAAAGDFATQVQDTLRRLAMPQAVVDVRVGGNRRGDQVEFLLGANPGEPVLPLAKVASGGELARAMLALRLVLTAAPPTLIFDEVDAGIGGAASVEVGRALAEIGSRHQVLVVTHLAQVAAFADTQIAVSKQLVDGRTVTTATAVSGEDRVIELTRMLAGDPASAAGRKHAAELLEMRGRATPSG